LDQRFKGDDCPGAAAKYDRWLVTQVLDQAPHILRI